MKLDYWCHHTMRKLKSLKSYVRALFDSPAKPNFWSHHSPDTNMRVNRSPEDFRVQSSKSPLTIDSFPTEAPDIMKKRHPFCVPPEFIHHWMNKHENSLVCYWLWLDWLISRSRYLEHASTKVRAGLDIDNFEKKGKHLKRIRTYRINFSQSKFKGSQTEPYF